MLFHSALSLIAGAHRSMCERQGIELHTFGAEQIMDAAELSEVLRAIGWSSNELARRLSIRVTTVADWLNGRRAVPDNVAAWLTAHRDAQGQVPFCLKDGGRAGRLIRQRSVCVCGRVP